MTVNIVNYLDEETWRKFVDVHPQGNIFHTPEMFQVFARAKGHKPSLWAAVDDSFHPLALLLPVQISLKGGIFYSWTTRAVSYGSVSYIPTPEGKEALKSLLKAYRRKMQGRILFTELRNMSDLSDYQPVLQEAKFVFEDHLNYLIDLDQPEGTLWQNMSKSGRQRVRISENKGTVIEEVADRRQLMLAYQLLQGVYTRVRVPLAHISLFETAYDILAPRDKCKIFLARVGDHYIGTSFILMHNGKILAWYSGSDRAFSSYNSGELLKWHIFKWGKEHGFHAFDFGGAGKPDEVYGPRDFKAKFGGKLVNFGRNTCVHSPQRLQISKNVYSWMRRVSFFRSPDPRKQDNVEN